MSYRVTYLVSAIKRYEHTAKLIDGQTIQGDEFNSAIERIQSSVIAISSYHLNLQACFDLVAQLRDLYSDEKIIVVWGRGPNSLPLDYFFARRS